MKGTEGEALSQRQLTMRAAGWIVGILGLALLALAGPVWAQEAGVGEGGGDPFNLTGDRQNVKVELRTLTWLFNTVTPLGEGYFGSPSGDLSAGGAGALDVFDFGPFPGNSPEAGVMLFSNGDRGIGNRRGATEETETLLFLAPGVEAPAPLPEEKKKKKVDDDDDEDDDDEDDDD